jgi:transposase
VIAARQPEMRFVAPKTAEQQPKAVMFRSRERLVHQRTELLNALRAVLYEYGHVFPTGLVHLKRVEARAEDQACALPARIIAECRDLLAQIAEKTKRIDARNNELKALAPETDTARRLQTMPGVGPLRTWRFRLSRPTWRSSSLAETLRPGWGSCLGSIPPEARSGLGVSRSRARAIFDGFRSSGR